MRTQNFYRLVVFELAVRFFDETNHYYWMDRLFGGDVLLIALLLVLFGKIWNNVANQFASTCCSDDKYVWLNLCKRRDRRRLAPDELETLGNFVDRTIMVYALGGDSVWVKRDGRLK